MTDKYKIYQLVRIIAFNIALMFVLLALCEVCLRIVHPILYKRMNQGRFPNICQGSELKQYPLEKDEDLGWVFRPKDRVMILEGIEYKSNKQGFRDDKDFSLESTYSDKANIVLLGDSFVFGYGVEKSNAMADLLEKRLNMPDRVFNLAVLGWGIDQMYLAYQKYSGIIKPKIVVLIFIDDDIRRVVESYREGMSKPCFVLADNRLKIDSQQKIGMIEKIFQRSYLLNIPYRVAYSYFYSKKITEAIFLELNEFVRQANGGLIIIRLPEEQMLSSSCPRSIILRKFFDFRNFCKENNIKYFDLYDEISSLPEKFIKSLYSKDGHISRDGHEHVANFLITKVFK